MHLALTIRRKWYFVSKIVQIEYIRTIRIQIWKKYWDLEICKKSQKSKKLRPLAIHDVRWIFWDYIGKGQMISE